MQPTPNRPARKSAALVGTALALPLFLGHQGGPIRFSIDFQGEVPGLRYRNEPGSLFKRSATAFETELGMSTAAELQGAVNYLATRYGIQAACPPMPMVDVFRSDFMTGNIVMTDGAWAIYTEQDLGGMGCPQSSLDPRQPTFYFETIVQKGDFHVDMSVGEIAVPVHPDVKLVQVLMLPARAGIQLGGTYAAEHGPYELVPIQPADLTEPYDDLLYGEMRFSWGRFHETVHFESIEPNTTTPMGGKRMTFGLSHPRFGTGIYEATYNAYATSWGPDPELTGNAALGIPRNPILTPRTINFRYTAAGRFPHSPSYNVHSPCTNDFSNPANLAICPPDVPTTN